ncbi:MAG: FRG domain-containing protein [Firmicutes bacterium]|nr:FRG domain-containing protein [Bacillota bacterium]
MTVNNSGVRVSSNGYDFLESYTTEIYGERGSFRHNLERYVYSEDFQTACRMPKSVEEIPELSFDLIKQQIQREEYFKQYCQHVMDVFSQRAQAGILTDEDYLEVAGIMGLCPGHGDWHETLFPHLVDLFVSGEEEGEAIWQSVESNLNIIRVMVTVMCDGIRHGQIINHNGRNMLSLGYARNYFRGENAYYSQSFPSMYRNMPADDEEIMLRRVTGHLRMIEFSLWLNSLSVVKSWPYGDVFHGALAQHYGLPTNGIDMTSDLKVALFFACCTNDNGAWRPLKEAEYCAKDARDSVAGLGGDSRYGIIFTAPADTANMSMTAQIPELHLASVTPVGIQPFMRCASQSAYIIEAGYPYDLYQDPSFSKFKFRLTPKICEWIFAEMDEGRKIFPVEDIGPFEAIVKRIREAKRFSQRAFDNTYAHLRLTCPKDELKNKLQQNGIEIVAEDFCCSVDENEALEQCYRQYLEKKRVDISPQIKFRFSI